MNKDDIERLLNDVRTGAASPEDAARRLETLPFEDLGFAKVDHHRALRRGFPEVVFGEGKPPGHIAAIVDSIAGRGQNVLVTRTPVDAVPLVSRAWPAAHFDQTSRCLTVAARETPRLPGRIAVVCAGTSDLPVAEEAVATARFHGGSVDTVYDAGVAGLHRLLDRMELLRSADVVVAVAGMEGALPSVVAGLVDVPVIAVPTSVGYGSSFNGLAALLAMLNSCASGITVVNIDNGFGAGYQACLILRGWTRRTARESLAGEP